ncbi:MAG: MBOAT family protein [Bacteroidetes bacterium]|nr:MBOAT family protein [Bacteroidota bacterium]
MVFNSGAFLVFFAVTFLLYYLVKPKYQWGLLILSSSFFLMYHVPAFMLVLAPVILFNYFTGIYIGRAKTEQLKKWIFIFSTFVNLAVLVFFKYINFIIENVGALLHLVNSDISLSPLSILLPLGISFYTFQVIGYNLEIYWENSEPERHLGYFATYLMFFPKLISGPIERAHHFLPQVKIEKKFNRQNITAGFQLILWGLFKKLVIADRIDPTTNMIFNNVNDYHGISLMIGIGLYVIQIYADFSGYTDIALGLARTLGYNLTDNFNRPFQATSISEFWRRWHISLSSWVTDYIYTPVSANKRHWGKFGTIYALIITFTVLGFWHGASWNYIIYGLLHALAVSFEYLTSKSRKKISSHIPAAIYIPFSRLMTIGYLAFTMIFFRFQTFGSALTAIRNMFTDISFKIFGLHLGLDLKDVIIILSGILIIHFVERLKAERKDIRLILSGKPTWIRYSVYYFFILSIMLFGSFGVSEFIYFQF